MSGNVSKAQVVTQFQIQIWWSYVQGKEVKIIHLGASVFKVYMGNLFQDKYLDKGFIYSM